SLFSEIWQAEQLDHILRDWEENVFGLRLRASERITSSLTSRKVYFMHIGGMGDAGELAAGVKKVYDKIAEVRAAQQQPKKAFSGANVETTNAISPEPLE